MYRSPCHRTLCAFLVVTLIGEPAHAQQVDSVEGDGLYAAPRDGGVRRWRIADSESVVLLDVPGVEEASGEPLLEDAILANFGCVEAAGALWCEVRLLHGGPLGFVAAKDLRPVAGPDGIIARGINDSAERAKRRRFDTTAEIQCAQEQGQALGPCSFGVARSGGGDATAAITFANGFTRLLFFMHGEFVSASATMSGAGRDTDWRLKGGIHYIRTDDQQFEITNTLLFGDE